MEKEILISVKDISRRYGQQYAIDKVSFNVHRGEILGLLGTNGAGKSTTMQIICGVLAAHHGTVDIAGHNINQATEQAKAHIGFLPEQPPLYADLTVDEFLNYAGKLRGLSSDEIVQAVEKSKQRSGLKDSGKRLIQNLSKGYKQRVGIAQAVIHSPSVIVLDEPTSGLDPIQISEIRKLLLELAEHHSIILSTHILSEVQSVCDRVLIINQGKIVLDKPTQQLQNNVDNIEQVDIALRTPPPIQAVQAIEGIAKAEVLADDLIRVDFVAGVDATEQLITKAVTEKWGLYKLIPGGISLESTFMQLTQQHEQTSAGSGVVTHE